ncbi:MAG TPA: DoxX family protein [Gemmatimonadales bacterium]|nr:DoxX family protein [Gemmatimonadales bacterium]
MNRLSPYAAFIMRLAVGGVFLRHGIMKYHWGVAGVAGFLHSIPVPFASAVAVYLIAVETVGAACVLLGFFTRAWAGLMAANMVVAILAVQLPKGANFEVEALLLAGAVTLVALGDGPLSVAIGLRQGN